ncbi:QsdR family transcriptional regulator [Actinophytocola xanthii]|uniref:Transcriptional regulator n=1 Tax=Actinophytocola xanthii TaxID=1912961 RepID=A0A1Q8CLD1_9PSEU|nr:QsdR family transcriptional regulator [Actinophytocola xanthii]OLF15149.1 transcriptional regulator [Actinophytocola xanthii]
MSATAEEIVRAAAHWIGRGARLDTRTFATALGISRSTLFRRVGNREELMGEALWYLADRTMAAALRAWQAENGDRVRDDSGELRCLAVMRRYRSDIAGNEGFRRLLDEEPTVAIRVLTDPQGRVQPRVMSAHVDLLRRDVEDGGFVPAVSLESLCYAIVRLGEAFLYSDVLVGRAPDLEAASTLLAALVEAGVPARESSVRATAL